jgi:small-conductance mechanosensitive channel
VREIGTRATTLTTFEGADVVVPNGTLLSEKLVNWTLSDMNRRIDVNVGVAYGSTRGAIALLTEITTAVPGISSFPAPSVILPGLAPARSISVSAHGPTTSAAGSQYARSFRCASTTHCVQRASRFIPAARRACAQRRFGGET